MAIDFEKVARAALAAALRETGLSEAGCEISLMACGDAEIATLNASFRGKPVPTNVLSWPAVDLSPEADGDTPTRPVPDATGELVLGDIAIAFETCAREAKAADKTLESHASHLIVHGLLHLLGFDHVREGDAARMEALETKILGTLGIDDPYRE